MKVWFLISQFFVVWAVSGFAQGPGEPVHVPFEETTRILWGDETSGKVHDSRFYGGNRIMFQIFGMEPWQVFRHSDRFTTLFIVDGIYYVLSGTLFVNNPETGEVIRIQAGELGFLPRNKWNHGFAYSDEEVRVLEFLPRRTTPTQPQPFSGSQDRPTLSPPKYAQDKWIGNWPAGIDEARRESTHRLVRDSDILWRLEGENVQVLVGIMASTDQITMGKIILQPGQETDIRTHGGDEGIYVETGRVHVRFPNQLLDERGSIRFFDVKQGEGIFLPEGTPHRYYNQTKEATTLIFGVAPHYLPGG